LISTVYFDKSTRVQAAQLHQRPTLFPWARNFTLIA